MYKHCDINNEFISLHDCRVTKILYEKDIITFVFDGGIWLLPNHPNNATNKMILTDKAEVSFTLEFTSIKEPIMLVFEERFKNTICKKWNLYKLIHCINDKRNTLEFLYRFNGYNSIIIECCLWSSKKPYHRECELKLSIKDEKYYWNSISQNKEY